RSASEEAAILARIDFVSNTFSIFFSGLLRHRFGCEPLLRQRGRIIEIRFTLASVFLRKFIEITLNRCICAQGLIYPTLLRV
ncbi:hypothetical protein ACSJR2_003419, partial [Vibrio cholerae]